jgi:3',5'-cyclic AMP phosphodiesterase CpdA
MVNVRRDPNRTYDPHLMRRSPVLVLSVALCAWFALSVGAQTPTPKPDAPPPVFFLQFSDPQFGMFTANKDFVQETANFEMAIATANRLRPAFIVVTGDLVNKAGDAKQIAEYRRIAARLSPSIPLYNVAGNHDVENEPTPATVAAYVRAFGRDYYSFRSGSIFGIVLNSSLIKAPDTASELYAAQEKWLDQELGKAKASGAQHIVVFQHHPWFLKDFGEADEYFNIPLARRGQYVERFRSAGVRYLFSGHYHRNAIATTGNIQAITTGPVGMPLGDGSQSGMRVVIVNDGALSHRFYTLGELPAKIELPASRPRH